MRYACIAFYTLHMTWHDMTRHIGKCAHATDSISPITKDRRRGRNLRLSEDPSLIPFRIYSGNTLHEAVITSLIVLALYPDTVTILPDSLIAVVVWLDLVVGVQCQAEEQHSAEEYQYFHSSLYIKCLPVFSGAKVALFTDTGNRYRWIDSIVAIDGRLCDYSIMAIVIFYNQTL